MLTVDLDGGLVDHTGLRVKGDNGRSDVLRTGYVVATIDSYIKSGGEKRQLKNHGFLILRLVSTGDFGIN